MEENLLLKYKDKLPEHTSLFQGSIKQERVEQYSGKSPPGKEEEKEEEEEEEEEE